MHNPLPGVLNGLGLGPPKPEAKSAEAALIGYRDQGNLGMGCLAAVLQTRGHRVPMIDVRDEPEQIAERLLTQRPVVVGFSPIFQVFLPQFRRLATYLRPSGITGHFAIGGHFPSLAYLQDGRIVETQPRALIENLDSLPFPYRPYDAETIGGFPTMPLLAGRGCARRCSFCSIRRFYRDAPGKVVRGGKPEKVVGWSPEPSRGSRFSTKRSPPGRTSRRWRLSWNSACRCGMGSCCSIRRARSTRSARISSS